MVHKLLTWWEGYVKVRMPLKDAGRFINLSGNHGVEWWGVSRTEASRDKASRTKTSGDYAFKDYATQDGAGEDVTGFIRRRDYYRLRNIARKTGTFPLVVQRFGGYFLWRQAVGRASFWCGIVCFCILLFFFSTRIWEIEVQGQSHHTRESILAYLDSLEIYGGMSVRDVQCATLERKLRQKYEDVGWVSVEKSGSVLYVRLEEVALQEQQQEVPGSLVAGESGEVVSIVTRQGTSKVRAGDKVKKGKILISGKVKIVGDNEEVVGRQKVQAQGNVVLRCSKEYENRMAKESVVRKYTGRSRSLYQWQFGQKNLFYYNPLKRLETYEKCDIIREGGCICPFISLRFPVSMWKKTFLEVRDQKVIYSRQEAQEQLEEEYQYALQQMEGEGCFDITGDLKVKEERDFYVARAKVVYFRQQTEYR